MSREQLVAEWLGTRDYGEMLAEQDRRVEDRRSKGADDVVLLLEHPPTYTLGRRSEIDDLGDPEQHRLAGIDVCRTPRGGGITYHGPGQLVAYPIIDLRGVGCQPPGATRVDVAGFVTALESAMCETLGKFGVEAFPIPGLTGIWVGEGIEPGAVTSGRTRKVGSIGLRVNRGITSHGISLNLDLDLEPFERVRACGMDDCHQTSVALEVGSAPDARQAGEIWVEALAGVLERSGRAASGTSDRIAAP